MRKYDCHRRRLVLPAPFVRTLIIPDLMNEHEYRVSSDLPHVKEIDSNDRKAESRNRAPHCSALCRNGTTIKMVGTTFYRLSSRLSDDVDDDDGSGQRSLTFASRWFADVQRGDELERRDTPPRATTTTTYTSFHGTR